MDPKLALHGFAGTVGAALTSGQLTPPGAPAWLQGCIMLAGVLLTAFAAWSYDPEHMGLSAKTQALMRSAGSISVSMPVATSGYMQQAQATNTLPKSEPEVKP